MRPCNASSCPFAEGVTYPQFLLSGSGTTELSVAVGSYAVDFMPPPGHLFVGPESGETMGARITGNAPATVTFAVEPMSEQKAMGTLRIATPLIPLVADRGRIEVRSCTGSSCYVLYAAMMLAQSTVTELLAPAGDYQVTLRPPQGFSLQGPPGSDIFIARVIGGQTTTVSYLGTLGPTIPPAPPTAAFGTLVVEVSGLGAEVSAGGIIVGQSEVYGLGPFSIAKTGVTSIPVPAGHWMDHYYWIDYLPPSGYEVSGGVPAKNEVWFLQGDSTTTWRINVAKRK